MIKVSPEFKKEFSKALRLSLFLTIIMFGMLIFSARKYVDPRVSRSIASDAEEESGMSEKSSGRAVPPYERQR